MEAVVTQLENRLFYGPGLAALAGASPRHRVGGYRSPTDLSPNDWLRAIAHVIDILGPGATLGTGVLPVGLDACSYHAVDAFDLAGQTPPEFYRALAAAALPVEFDRARVPTAIEALGDGRLGPIGYAIQPGFDIVKATGGRAFDLILSNAAFEHFDAVGAVLAQITVVARPRGKRVAGVDFQTHTRGIRGADPKQHLPVLPEALSEPHVPRGSRTSVGPGYVQALRRLGWMKAECRPVDLADAKYRALEHTWSARVTQVRCSEHERSGRHRFGGEKVTSDFPTDDLGKCNRQSPEPYGLGHPRPLDGSLTRSGSDAPPDGGGQRHRVNCSRRASSGR